MTNGAIVCPACGAKVSATRTRCPRCRAELTTSPAPSDVQLSRNAGKIAGVVLAVACIATVVILWRSGDEPPPASPAKAVNPAASARPAAATVPGVPTPPAFELASGLTGVPESGDDAAALARLQRELEGDPQNAATMYNIGRLFLRQRKPALAVAPLTQAFTLKADNWSYAFSAGYALGLASRFPEAATAFRAARALEPSDPATTYNLAVALQRQADHAAAAEEYAAAIALNSAAISPRLGRAIALDRLGNSTQAIAAYEECLQMMPAGQDADRVRARAAHLRGG